MGPFLSLEPLAEESRLTVDAQRQRQKPRPPHHPQLCTPQSLCGISLQSACVYSLHAEQVWIRRLPAAERPAVAEPAARASASPASASLNRRVSRTCVAVVSKKPPFPLGRVATCGHGHGHGHGHAHGHGGHRLGEG